MPDFPNNQNFYDVNNGGILTDAATGNRFINGVWTSPQGTQYINGQWVRPTRPTNTGGSSAGQGGGYNAQAGFGMNILEQAAAQEKFMQELRGRQAKELAELERASKMQFSQMDSDLKMRLANQQISHEQYQQMKSLAQQESEFARRMAQQQLEFNHKAEMDKATLEISRAAEMRQERVTQANLAANPQDWVAYEFYKRSINGGKPVGAAAGAGTPAAAGATGTGGASGALTMLDGTPYAAAPGSYDDASIQGLASSLFNNGGAINGGYNPGLAGTGAFGAKIEAPNTLTRAEAGAMSEAEVGMLGGLLKAGIKGPNGQMMALDPKDYFKQAQESWVPTMNESGAARTQYS